MELSMSQATLVRLGNLAVIVCAGLIGCSSKKTQRTEEPGVTNLRKIGQAYDFFTQEKHRAPQNDEELKPMFKELGDNTNPDEILISKRDGKPFVILYGPKMDSDARDIILAHEQDGADGKRYVLTQDRMVREMSDEEFANAKFAGSKSRKK
jgi:hypothetical protein